MRIAMISYHTCPLASEEGKETGGMNVYVYNLSLELARLGHQIDVFTRSEDPHAKKIVEVVPGFRVIHLNAGPEKSLPKHELINFIPEFSHELSKYFLPDSKILNIKSKFPYDIFHAHYYMSGLAVIRLNQQLAINIQHTTNSRGGVLPPIGREDRAPTVMSFHTLALLKNLVARSEAEAEPPIRITAEMEIAQKFDKIIAPSAVEREYLKYFYSAKSTHVEIIPPGYDANLFKPMDKTEARRKIGADPKHKIILFVGRIEPLKGLDVLMYALKILVQKCPDCQICLWIVGGEKELRDNRLAANGNEARYGETRQTATAEKPKDVADVHETGIVAVRRNPEIIKLYDLRDTLKLHSVIKFVGQQHQSQLPFYYNAADVVVMPSHYESFGMSALEAMACGTPVVTTNVTGISTIFENDGQHTVISANNPIQLANAIENIISVGVASRRPLGARTAPLQNIKNFTWEKMAKRMEKVYEALR